MSEVSEIFECTQCGYCCHGETTVSLNNEDQQRMVESLGVSKDTVKKRYWRVTGTVIQMKIVDGHCIFYSKGCGVHKGRPWRCAQWPLHPSILTDENNFLTISESCPGIKRDIGYKKFCEKLKEAMENGLIVC
jgi:Fe-S-cluster containining protein